MGLPATKYPYNSRVVTGTVNVYNDDVILLCDTTDGPVTINLQDYTAGYWNTLYKLHVFDNSNNAGTHNITIVAPTNYFVNNQSSIIIGTNGGGVNIEIADDSQYIASGSATGGHIIQDEGVSLPQQPKLNFVGAGVTVTNDPTNHATVVTIAGGGGSGITSLNGLTVATQTFATDETGTDFGITSSGSVHTFHLPIASAVNTGKLSSADWIVFNNKMSGSGTADRIPKFLSAISIGDGTWEFPSTTNTLRPVTTGSDIGDSTHRVSTLYMSSTINYGFLSSMIFSENGTETMRILTGGKVGIGTATPSTALQIVGTYVSTLSPGGIRLTSDYPGISFDNTSVSSNARNFAIINGVNSNGVLEFSYSTVAGGQPTSNGFSFDAINNQFSIGVVIPHALGLTNRLAVNGSVAIGSGLVDSNAPTDGLIVSGFVGIGTSTVSDRLTVSGTNSSVRIITTSTTDAHLDFSVNGSSTRRGQIYVDNATGSFNFYTVNGQTIFYNGVGLAQDETMRMTFDSRFGIGTGATVSALFHVKNGGTATSSTSLFETTGTTTGIILKAVNGASANLFSIRDDGYIQAGTTDATTGRLTIGNNAGWGADGNTFLGTIAGRDNTTGYENTAIGHAALTNSTTGVRNTAIGRSALRNTSTGAYNVAIGMNALTSNVSGEQSIGIGYRALEQNTAGDNVAIGWTSMYLSTTTTGNTAIGSATLSAITTGTGKNTAIGNSAGQNLTGSSNIFLGYGAGRQQVAVDNKLLISNQIYSSSADELTNSIIYGVMDASPVNQTLTFNANVGIGVTPASNYKLQIKAIGSTSATSSIIVKNDSNQLLLEIVDDRSIFNLGFNGYSSASGKVTFGWGSNAVDTNATAIGYGAQVTAVQGVAVGDLSLATSLSTMIGAESGKNGSANGGSQVGVGYRSLRDNTGLGNTAIGTNALLGNLTGDLSIGLGYNAGIFETASRTLYIHNGEGVSNLATGKTNSIIYGQMNATAILQILTFNAAVVIGSGALATNATDGFLHVPSCAGVPTGVPTLYTGTIPVVVDSTNNKMYIYSGGSWVALN